MRKVGLVAIASSALPCLAQPSPTPFWDDEDCTRWLQFSSHVDDVQEFDYADHGVIL